MTRALRVSEADNVAVALDALEAGAAVEVAGRRIVARQPIPSGHKIALRPIAAGAAVIRYGSPIGLATSNIAPGDHVHTHNVESTRGRGDRGM